MHQGVREADKSLFWSLCAIAPVTHLLHRFAPAQIRSMATDAHGSRHRCSPWAAMLPTGVGSTNTGVIGVLPTHPPRDRRPVFRSCSLQMGMPLASITPSTTAMIAFGLSTLVGHARVEIRVMSGSELV